MGDLPWREAHLPVLQHGEACPPQARTAHQHRPPAATGAGPHGRARHRQPPGTLEPCRAAGQQSPESPGTPYRRRCPIPRPWSSNFVGYHCHRSFQRACHGYIAGQTTVPLIPAALVGPAALPRLQSSLHPPPPALRRRRPRCRIPRSHPKEPSNSPARGRTERWKFHTLIRNTPHWSSLPPHFGYFFFAFYRARRLGPLPSAVQGMVNLGSRQGGLGCMDPNGSKQMPSGCLTLRRRQEGEETTQEELNMRPGRDCVFQFYRVEHVRDQSRTRPLSFLHGPR
eukprot:gene7271-biopygen1497